MVEDECLSGSKLNFSSILNSRQLANRLINVSFIEDSITLPKDEDGVLTFVQLLQKYQNSS